MDRDRLIKAWEIFRDSNPYEICDGREFIAIKEPEYCMGQMIEDTIALLKEQEDCIRILTSDLEDLHKEHEKLLDKKIPLITNGQEVVRCKDCAYALFKEGVQPGHVVCTKPFTERWQTVKPDNWFCADGLVKDNCSEIPNN